MKRGRMLLSGTALAVGTLLSFSGGAAPAEKGPAAPKQKTYRCRVGNGKGAHYVDSAYPCPPARR